MSADLFAVFGTPDEAPTKAQLDERWTVSGEGHLLTPSVQTRQSGPSDSNVIFDADEAATEDDFGDFEDVEATHSHDLPEITEDHLVHNGPKLPTLGHQVNLVELGDEHASENELQLRQSASLEVTHEVLTTDDVDDWGDFEDFSQEIQPYLKPTSQKTAAQVSSPIQNLQPDVDPPQSKDKEWDDFEEWNAEQGSISVATNTNATNHAPRQHIEFSDEPRPTNIPPPTILLQLLPQVFQCIHELAKTSHEATEIEETAASIVTVFVVSARIIAGRSLRWKRDTYLAQSTRIGPSTSGARSGGMKLTAVNKSEAIREEREAADVCDAWSGNTHVFAGIVSRSDHRRPWMNLNIKMTPRPSPGFGTLEAKEPCALCGIKRDERIAGVDFDADDVFSEYWTEHWGHTDCKVFWYTYKEMLDHR